MAVLLTEAVVTAGAVFASAAVGRCTHCCHDDSVGESNTKRAGVKGKYISLTIYSVQSNFDFDNLVFAL